MSADQPGGEPEIDEILGDIGEWFKDWVSRTSKLLLVSLALLVIGFLGGVTARSDFFWFLFFVGLVLLGVWFFRRHRIGLPRILGKEEVVEQWDTLIADGQGGADTIFEDTQRLIEESKAPDIQMERRKVAPGFIRGVLGGRRDFLLVSNDTNSHLKPFRMYINARDYGDNLQVSWYVVHQPGFWRKVRNLLLLAPGFNLLVLPFYLLGRLTKARQAGLLDLDIFDQQDLTAYVTCAHHCLREAVEDFMMGVDQDTSEIDWKSKGFLGIS